MINECLVRYCHILFPSCCIVLGFLRELYVIYVWNWKDGCAVALSTLSVTYACKLDLTSCAITPDKRDRVAAQSALSQHLKMSFLLRFRIRRCL